MIAEWIGYDLAMDIGFVAAMVAAACSVVALFRSGGGAAASGDSGNMEQAGRREISKIVGFGRKFADEISSKTKNFELLADDVLDAISAYKDEIAVLSGELQVLRDMRESGDLESLRHAVAVVETGPTEQPAGPTADDMVGVDGEAEKEQDVPEDEGLSEAMEAFGALDAPSRDGSEPDGTSDAAAAGNGENTGDEPVEIRDTEEAPSEPEGSGDGTDHADTISTGVESEPEDSPFDGFDVPDDDDMVIGGEDQDDDLVDDDEEMFLDEF